MTYTKRLDGRKFDETRPIECKVGVVPNATGSASFKIGNTWAIAAVYGPKDLHPRFLQNPEKGKLRCQYNMLPFSGTGDRIRPGGNRRSKEISLVTEKALESVMDLSEYPNKVVDVFIEFPQTDAGSRCAGICAASMALADAGFNMKELVSAVAVGEVDGQVCVDLEYAEEAYPEGHVSDIPIAMTLPLTKKISLLQMDGPSKKEKIIEALKMAEKPLLAIYEAQKEALMKKFEVHENDESND